MLQLTLRFRLSTLLCLHLLEHGNGEGDQSCPLFMYVLCLFHCFARIFGSLNATFNF